MNPRRLLALGLSACCAAGAALAQVQDPTRPPGAMPGQAIDGTPLPVESGVQAVILRPNGKSGAVVNGQYVVVGGKLGEKRVIRITESEVVLKGESGNEVIKVMPAVEKVTRKKPVDAKGRAPESRVK